MVCLAPVFAGNQEDELRGGTRVDKVESNYGTILQVASLCIFNAPTDVLFLLKMFTL